MSASGAASGALLLVLGAFLLLQTLVGNLPARIAGAASSSSSAVNTSPASGGTLTNPGGGTPTLAPGAPAASSGGLPAAGAPLAGATPTYTGAYNSDPYKPGGAEQNT